MKTVSIGDLTEPVRTWNPGRDPEREFSYIDLSAVDNSHKTIVGATTTIGAEAPSRARQLVSAGDVLVSTVRPNLNAVAMVPSGLSGSTASTGFTVLRPSPAVEGRYLFHWVRSAEFIGDMVRKATGASYPAVSDRIVKDSLIPAPPLSEQQRIAAILDQADAIRAKRRQVLAHLDSLTQSIFHDMFDKRADQVQRLDALIDSNDRMNYGVVQPGNSDVDGVPLIRVSDLRDGLVDRSALKRIDSRIEEAYSRSRLRGTEILVSSVGSIGTVSVTSSADIGSNVARAITRVPISDPDQRAFVAAYLRAPVAQQYFRSEVRTVAQPTLNVGQLAATPVPVPPAPLQGEFALRASQISKQRVSVQRALAADDELFASLQSRAFRGEL